MTRPIDFAIDLSEKGLIPDTILRKSIRHLVYQRLQTLAINDCEKVSNLQRDFIHQMDQSSIAPSPEKANEQHYEVPAELFRNVLGKNMKYSSCYWQSGDNLDSAEDKALALTCEHADIQNGMKILELGCGWGSLTLWIASNYPDACITGISNSDSQREYIMSESKRRGLDNIEIITVDMNDFNIKEKFDRIVSVEMFEHMRNYRHLFKLIANVLNDDGRFFMHIFCHRSSPYEFIVNDPSDWMSQYFFSGGMMPSDGLPLFFQERLIIENKWRWDGRHYEKTANAWLENMNQKYDLVFPVLEKTYGVENAQKWWMRWRIFFMSCAELFGYENGQQWWVSHYLFNKNHCATK